MLRLRRAHRAAWDDLFHGAVGLSALHALMRVGFLDFLSEKTSVDARAFAASRELDPDILQSLCETLVALKILRSGSAGFALTPKGRLLGETMRGWIDLSYGYQEIFNSLDALLRKERAYGRDFFRRGDLVAKGSGEMESWLFFPWASDIVRRGKYKRVLDLGCGDGTFLRHACAANKDLSAFGIDVEPRAVEDGRKLAKEAGLEGRLQLSVEDISKIAGVQDRFRGIDVAFVFFVLHELLYDGDQRVVAFLRDFRRVFPNVPLVVFEAIRPTVEQLRRRPGLAIYYFLYHDLSRQKPVQREKWIELFRQSGFESIEERYLSFARTAVFTLR